MTLSELIDKTKFCLVNMFNLGEKNEPVIKIFEKSGLNDALATAVWTIENIFTFGAWGEIKGGYYIIQLGLDIAHAYQLTTEDLAFKIGKIFGKGMMIGKSLLLCKRKTKKIFK